MGRETWPADKVEELRALWPTGLSASLIGRKIGYSRLAVIGKAHRLHLEPRTTTETLSRGTFRAPARPKPQAPPPPDEPEPIGASGEMLGHGLCKFIRGDVQLPGWRMCGHETGNPALSWCPYHFAVCTQPKKAADAA